MTLAEKPHPYLLAPVLFISGLPPSVKENDVIEAFKDCDDVRVVFSQNPHYSRWPRSGRPTTTFGRIEFTTIALAEKALATLHLRTFPNVEQLTPLVLSITLNRAILTPPQSISPRLIRGLPADYKDTELYDLLRPFGPVASARVGSGLGGIVQFWKEKDACEAELNVKQILPRGQEITIQAFDHCNLFCTNLSLEVNTDSLRTRFEEFGHAVVSARVMAKPNGQCRGYGFISFRTSEEASTAMKAMDGVVVGSKPMIVRFHEPKSSPKYAHHLNTTKATDPQPTAKSESVGSGTVVGEDNVTCKEYMEGGYRPDTKVESWRFTIPMAERASSTPSNENVKPGVPDHQRTDKEHSGTSSLGEEERKWQGEAARLLTEVEKLRADGTEYQRVVVQERERHRAEADAEKKLLQDLLQAQEEGRKEAEESLRRAKFTERVEAEAHEQLPTMAESRRKEAEVEKELLRDLLGSEEERRKEAEESLRRAQAERDKFVMAESHRKEADEEKKLLQDLLKAEEERLKGAKAERDALRLEVEVLEQQFTISKSLGMEADEEKKLLQDLLKVEEERLKGAKAERDALRLEVEVLKKQFTIAKSLGMEAAKENELLHDLLRAEDERLREGKVEQDTLRLEVELLERQFSMADSARMEAEVEKQSCQDLLRAEEERRKEVEESLRQAKVMAESWRREADEDKKLLQDLLKAEAERDTLRVEVEALERQFAMAESRRKIVELEADRPLWEEARRKRETQEKARAEELRRQAEVAESRRKMREFMAREAERRRDAEAAHREDLRRAAEEQAKKELEEAEQKVREKEERERKERARLETLRREKNWKLATKREQARCQLRDRKLWGFGPWTNSRALQRFKSQIEEFDKVKFSEAQPLTIEVVPWPVLAEPFDFEVGQLNWSMVEAFYTSTKREMVSTPAEYNGLLEKTHRMFHPDKWKCLLNTVLDEAQRKSLETAVNVVSQAITPLWRKSKGYD